LIVKKIVSDAETRISDVTFNPIQLQYLTKVNRLTVLVKLLILFWNVNKEWSKPEVTLYVLKTVSDRFPFFFKQKRTDFSFPHF